MLTKSIVNNITAIGNAIKWENHVDESKRHTWHENLINFQCELENLRFASSENPSVAAYGESQMGKSYLIEALLSDTTDKFCLSDGNKLYKFIGDINPSQDNAQNEATGVVTRFKRLPASTPNANADWLPIQLFSIADIILILIEAWCNEVVRPMENAIQYADSVEQFIEGIQLEESPEKHLLVSEVELAQIEKYLSSSNSSSGFGNVYSSGIIQFLRRECHRISHDDTLHLLRFLWNNDENFNRLFDDLVSYRHKLGKENRCFVEFSSILRRKGSILDVDRLKEMYSGQSDTVKVRIGDASEVNVSKAFLSALIAELEINVDSAKKIENRDFLNKLDILDFPGLKSSQEIKVEVLGVGDNIATVFKRGKVSYLFKKYSSTKRISALLFCQNHNDYHAGKLGQILEDWVKDNVGETPNDRAQTLSKTANKSPLLVVSTWFNENLKYTDEKTDDDINDFWNRRFHRVLESQVIKAEGLPDHWFNSWSAKESPFTDIYLLRSYKYSMGIFNRDEGIESDSNGTLQGNQPKCSAKPDYYTKPDYIRRLKTIFLSNQDVIRRLGGKDRAEAIWNAAATFENDGTKPIINHLGELAPSARNAREDKFKRDFENTSKKLYDFIDKEHHPDDPTKETIKAKEEVGGLVSTMDVLNGRDPYFWIGMMENLMISEEKVREIVFNQIKGNQAARPLSGPENQIFMSAGLSATVSRESNLQLLCDYLGVNSESECKERLLREGIELDTLLGKQQMSMGIAEQVVSTIGKMWKNDFLGTSAYDKIKQSFPSINKITEKLVALYDFLDMQKKLTIEVQHIMDTLERPRQVGIVASWLTNSLNSFVCEFGYEKILCHPQLGNVKIDLSQKNRDFRLAIDMDILDNMPYANGIDLLQQMAAVKRQMEQNIYDSNLRGLQKKLPEYRNRWQWQNRMRVAFALLSGIRSYDIKSNNELKDILDSIIKSYE